MTEDARKALLARAEAMADDPHAIAPAVWAHTMRELVASLSLPLAGDVDAVERVARAICANSPLHRGLDPNTRPDIGPDHTRVSGDPFWKLYVPAARAALSAQPPPVVVESAVMRSCVKHLRDEADFNLSWTDGRRGGPARPVEDYIKRRLEAAGERTAWADGIEALLARAALSSLRHNSAALDEPVPRGGLVSAALEEIARICHEENEHTGQTWSSMIAAILAQARAGLAALSVAPQAGEWNAAIAYGDTLQRSAGMLTTGEGIAAAIRALSRSTKDGG